MTSQITEKLKLCDSELWSVKGMSNTRDQAHISLSFYTCHQPDQKAVEAIISRGKVWV